MSAALLRLLTDAADRGATCPSNRELADALGYRDGSVVTKALGRLACHGEVKVERIGDRRCITITRTGRALISTEPSSAGRKHENRREAHCGLTPQEAAIMELWDESELTQQQIARRLGLPPKRVQTTINTYDGRADQAKFERDTAKGSAALLAAITQHFQQRIAA